jgi:hypothetical protein
MGDVVRRIDRYRLKTDLNRVFALLKEMRGDMERRHEYEQVRLYAIELKARQVLNSACVPSMLYAFYLNYARELHKLGKRMAGPSLAREANVLLEKWVARTLDRTVLERIRDEAFSVGESE